MSIKIPTPTAVAAMAAEPDYKIQMFLGSLVSLMGETNEVQKAKEGISNDYTFELFETLFATKRPEVCRQLTVAGWDVVHWAEVESGHNEYSTRLTLRPISQ